MLEISTCSIGLGIGSSWLGGPFIFLSNSRYTELRNSGPSSPFLACFWRPTCWWEEPSFSPNCIHSARSLEKQRTQAPFFRDLDRRGGGAFLIPPLEFPFRRKKKRPGYRCLPRIITKHFSASRDRRLVTESRVRRFRHLCDCVAQGPPPLWASSMHSELLSQRPRLPRLFWAAGSGFPSECQF